MADETSTRRVFAHPTYKNFTITDIRPNQSVMMVPDIYGPNGKMTAKVHYESADPDILSVDETGKVTGLKEGYGEILAYACGKLARYGLEVIDLPKGIKGFTGHRGFRKLCVENTMPSFKMAVEAGCDFVETDISVTKDKQLVLFHDTNHMKRMMGMDMKISDFTLEELKTMKFVSGAHLENYPDVRIPTFEEYLELIEHSESNPMIELKDESLSKENSDLLVTIRDMIDAHHLTKRCRVTSAIKDNLLAYEKINTSHHELWYILEKDFEDLDLLVQHQWNYSIKHSVAKKDFCQKVLDAGLKVDVWIINDARVAKKLLSWPCTSMTSDICLFNH